MQKEACMPVPREARKRAPRVCTNTELKIMGKGESFTLEPTVTWLRVDSCKNDRHSTPQS